MFLEAKTEIIRFGEAYPFRDLKRLQLRGAKQFLGRLHTDLHQILQEGKLHFFFENAAKIT
ncbi:hypothetical protein D3C76_1767550 [compost metagenome]